MSTNMFNLSDKRFYPLRWRTFRGKQLFQVIDERSLNGDEELLSVSHITGITPRKQKNVTMFQSESLVGYKICRIGDIAANTMWTWQGAIGVSSYFGVISPAYNVYRQKEDVYNSRYLDLLLRERKLIDVYHSLSTGIRPSRLRLYPEVFLTIDFPVPPREEQDQIVRFLDWKVSEINRLINIKRKEIERLEELKKAVVSHAVIRGLDGNEYSHIPLKRAFHILDNCRMPIAADMRNQNSEVLYDYYGASGAIDKIDGYTIDDDVLLIGEDGANLRLRNLPLIYQVHGKAWINNHAHILKPMDFMDYYYSFYMLETLDISIFITGAAQPKLTQEALRNLQIIAPPIEEQRKISAYLDVKCGKINTIIENKQSQIKALQEFKTRLISDVVTGKIDVCGIEIPEYEYTAEEADSDSEAEAEELDEGGEEE